MAGRVKVENHGETYELSEGEFAEYRRLVKLGIEETRALQIASGGYQDLVPPPVPLNG